ncbi:hypothetical protein P9112_014147 [Eukaryota sp. TZLM1-RC]
MSGPPPRKLDISFIEDKARRHICFSKRRSGLFKKAHELSVLTGTQVLLTVISEAGNVNTFATDRLQPLARSKELHQMLHTVLVQPQHVSHPLEFDGEVDGVVEEDGYCSSSDNNELDSPKFSSETTVCSSELMSAPSGLAQSFAASDCPVQE